jgi:hypothetical protein
MNSQCDFNSTKISIEIKIQRTVKKNINFFISAVINFGESWFAEK